MQRLISASFLSLALLAGCQQGPLPPAQPASGPGGADYRFGSVHISSVGFGPSNVRVFIPGNPAPSQPLPIVVFLHGYQAIETVNYQEWLEHLTRRGAVVLFPAWQHRFSLPQNFTPNAAIGVENGMEYLRNHGVPIDTDRVAFIGHSGGGVLAVNLSAWSVRGKLSIRPRAMLLAAPGRCVKCDQYRSPGIPVEAADSIPSDVALVVMNFGDDDIVGQWLGHVLFVDAVQVPRDRRSYLLVRTDNAGWPPLDADHRAPEAMPGPFAGDYVTDGLDYFGTWKIADALMLCAFDGVACDVALGEGTAQKDMGQWSDGTPVRPMLNDWER
ncbi:MAG: alpha/beta hydrolase fold domain-containing protein [Deltaproteobacteria bacterium]|nr:alpha/beta hydrolase fold domain-containing protein [Deltaproteobacteria bacterium]